MDDKIKTERDALEWLDRRIREEVELDGEMTNEHAIELAFIQRTLERFPRRMEVSNAARNPESLESPMDLNEQTIHIGDTVHMLITRHDGDHEWDDVVLSLEYVGRGGGDDWLVHGKGGAAWACECEVLKRRGDGDGK